MSPSPETLLAHLTALADPARLRLLHLLAAHELGVMELAEIVQMPQSSVSRHLKVLAAQGWVVSRSERTANLYSMANGDLAASARQLWQVAKAETAAWPALEQDRLRLERRLAARQLDSRGFFAGVAGEWERLRAELYGERFTGAAIAALLPRSWVVADLGCGSGTVTAELAPHVARIIAVDNSPEMLAAAKRRAGKLANVEFRRGDLAALPLADRSCDAALMLLALTHLEQPAVALAEMARILRAGGRAVVVDLLRHDREEFRRTMEQRRSGFPSEELGALLQASGLTAVECRPLPPEPGAKGPALLLATGSRPVTNIRARTPSRQTAPRVALPHSTRPRTERKSR
jgi:SAM-dependent methyltransferase